MQDKARQFKEMKAKEKLDRRKETKKPSPGKAMTIEFEALKQYDKIHKKMTMKPGKRHVERYSNIVLLDESPKTTIKASNKRKSESPEPNKSTKKKLKKNNITFFFGQKLPKLPENSNENEKDTTESSIQGNDLKLS